MTVNQAPTSSPTRLRAEVTLEADPATTRVLQRALAPEVEAPVPRTEAELAAGADGLTLTVGADDASAMRAALNSLLRFAHTALEVQGVDATSDPASDPASETDPDPDADADPDAETAPVAEPPRKEP